MNQSIAPFSINKNRPILPVGLDMIAVQFTYLWSFWGYGGKLARLRGFLRPRIEREFCPTLTNIVLLSVIAFLDQTRQGSEFEREISGSRFFVDCGMPLGRDHVTSGFGISQRPASNLILDNGTAVLIEVEIVHVA